MATILIQPVAAITRGGYEVQIMGIDPVSTDCLVGTVQTPGMGAIVAKWDLGGMCRGADTSCNLDMSDDDLVDLKEAAEHLCGKL